jgi:hypothetical protein
MTTVQSPRANAPIRNTTSTQQLTRDRQEQAEARELPAARRPYEAAAATPAASASDVAGARARFASQSPQMKALVENGLKTGVKEAQAAVKGLSPEVKATADQALDRLVDRATKDWQPHEKAALDRTMNTLDQLAGGDGKLNHGDKLAITNAVLQDTPGIINAAQREVRKRMGNGLVSNIVQNKIEKSFQDTRRFRRTGRRGLVQRIRENRRAKVRGAVAGVVDQQLNQALQKAGVDPSTAKKLDGAGRNVGVAQLEQLGRDVELLKGKLQSGRASALLDDGKRGQLIEQARQALDENVTLEAPLRNGIPSLKRADAVIDTLLDAAAGVQLK